IEVAVGPGVFVPRFETELLLEWGLSALSALAAQSAQSAQSALSARSARFVRRVPPLSSGADHAATPRRPPVVLDLCTGSGALALAIAHERPEARVYAVESDPDALSWARRNADIRARAGDTPI